LFRFALKSTGRRDEAEDVVQEVFVRVVRGLDGFRPVGRDAAWLFTIARRILIDRNRARDRRPSEPIAAREPASDARQETASVLAEALAVLAPADREAFLLREVGGLSYEEIARVCDTTIDGARSHIYRARMRLRALLSDRFEVRT
jgi:RNA polymerase sigma-70 factor, ECF subfamily